MSSFKEGARLSDFHMILRVYKFQPMRQIHYLVHLIYLWLGVQLYDDRESKHYDFKNLHRGGLIAAS